jgi:dTDP-4-dehydrorhamnose reductase
LDNLLITGVSGLLGNNLACFFRKKYKITGIYFNNKVVIEGINTLGIDLSDQEDVDNLINELKPEYVIHCASRTDIDNMEDDQERAWETNVAGTRNLVKAASKIKSKLIYISTDLVYPGIKGPYSENSNTSPINWYGITKLASEKEILCLKDYLILRTNIFGFNIQNKESLAEWFINRLKAEKETGGFIDARFSAIYTFLLAEIIGECILLDIKGIYNCSCRDSLTKYQFGIELSKMFSLNNGLIKPISIDDINFKAARAKDLSLDVSRLEKKLNHPLPEMIESIRKFYIDYYDWMKI